MDSLQSEIEQLHDFLGDNLLLFVLDEHTLTNMFISSNTQHLTEKELDKIFNSAFEEFNKESQRTEVNNHDTSDDVVNIKPKRSSKATWNFAKPVSCKDITEAIQKAVPEKTQRHNKYYKSLWEEWVLHNENITIKDKDVYCQVTQ